MRGACRRSGKRAASFRKWCEGLLFLLDKCFLGHKNNLELEVNGRELSLKWKQEEQNELWIGRHDQPNATMAKDPSLVSRDVLPYVHLPGGHQESWADAFRNLIHDAYQWIREG